MEVLVTLRKNKGLEKILPLVDGVIIGKYFTTGYDFEMEELKSVSEYVKSQNRKVYVVMDNFVSEDEKMLLYEIEGKKCGVLFAERNKSELGNYISVNHPELDLVVMLDASSRISYRTNRDDVNVSDFAITYGGGGHQKASGSKFDDEDRNKIIETYFKGAKRLEKEEEN